MPKHESRVPQDWINFAEEDLAGAVSLLSDPDRFPHLIALHCHQAAEKFFKAFLLHHRQEKPKAHDLVVLLNACKRIDNTFSTLLPPAQFLDALYLEDKYPYSPLPQYSPQELKSFIEAAKEIRAFVTTRVGPA